MADRDGRLNEETADGGTDNPRSAHPECDEEANDEEANDEAAGEGEARALRPEDNPSETDLEIRSDGTPIRSAMDSALRQSDDSGTVCVAGTNVQYSINADETGREYVQFNGDDLGMRGGSDVAIPTDADKEEAAMILRRRREQELEAAAEERGYDPRRRSTRRAYDADWRLFSEWCRDSGRGIPADAQTVAAYVRDMIGTYKASTMRRKLTAINHFHAKKGHAKPARKDDEPLRTTWRRFVQEGEATVDQAEAAVPEIVRLFIEDADETYQSACRRLQHEKRRKAKRIAWRRNRAGFVTSLYGALRVSELLGLRRKNVKLQPGAMILHLRQAKTATAGELQRVVIAENEGDGICPLEEMTNWVSLLESSVDGDLGREDPIFRGVDQWGNVRPNALRRQSWWKIVKAAAYSLGDNLRRRGYEPEDFSTHSFRIGFITYSGQIGYDEDRAMRHTRHKSLKVFRRYRREGEQMSRDTNMTSEISV